MELAFEEFVPLGGDRLYGDDQAIMAFCEAQNLPYTAPLSARALLPGGDSQHWT